MSSGESQGVSVARSQSKSVGYMRSDTTMQSDTETQSQADTTATAEGKAHTDATYRGTSVARRIRQSFSDGIKVGLAPSVSLGDANRWEFDPAVLLTHILRKQQELLNIITREGGFYTDVYALTSTERGKQELMALLPKAFHGVEGEIQAAYARGEEAVIASQIAV